MAEERCPVCPLYLSKSSAVRAMFHANDYVPNIYSSCTTNNYVWKGQQQEAFVRLISRDDYEFPQQSDPNCSSQLGSSSLNSPINIPNSALGGSLNPLQQRFGARGGLPYELPGNGVGFMGGAKPRKGGRRPGEEMDEINDPEEMEKRLKRRLRNKEAAARCRQRRLDLMQTLQEQVNVCQEENKRKQDEILSMKQKLDSLVEFLKKHDCQMPESERQKLDSLINMHPLVQCQQPSSSAQVITTSASSIANRPFKMETASPPLSDYQPQNPHTILGKRLPTTTDVNILEPDVKAPKIEVNQTLAQVNGDADVARPTSLDFTPINRGATSVTIATPSNYQMNNPQPTFSREAAPSYTNIFSGSEHNLFLNQPTGLTPSGAPTGVFVQTPTPLHNTDSELRSL